MLTADLIRPRLRARGDQISVTMIDVKRWSQTAAELIALLQAHLGQPMAVWDEALDEYAGDRTDYIVLRGLAKTLTDSATFTPLQTPLDPAVLREAAFALGPAFAQTDLFHPRTRPELLADAAESVGLAPDQLDALLYADRPAAYILTDAGPAWTPADLIARYNLELARGVLYWSDGMTVQLHDTYKDFFRYAKLFKLMFEARALPERNGYQVDLDGPISPFVSATTRYGRQFAAFLPALFLCEQWSMQASVRYKGRPLTFALDHTSPQTKPMLTHFRRSAEFDSRMEADFAAAFGEKFGGERGRWLLTREDEILPLGDTVMIPDFSVTHQTDGRRALIEIVGFWHPNYLRRKIEKVRAAGRSDLLLLVYEGVNLSPERLTDVPSEVLYFKNKPVLKEVMAAVERIAKAG